MTRKSTHRRYREMAGLMTEPAPVGTLWQVFGNMKTSPDTLWLAMGGFRLTCSCPKCDEKAVETYVIDQYSCAKHGYFRVVTHGDEPDTFEFPEGSEELEMLGPDEHDKYEFLVINEMDKLDLEDASKLLTLLASDPRPGFDYGRLEGYLAARAKMEMEGVLPQKSEEPS